MIRTFGVFAPVLGFAILAGFTSAKAATSSQSLTPVKLAFIEALAPRDTTSSERFQRDYESAIQTAKRLSEKRLASCGYRLDNTTAFYDASDPLQAKEKGTQAVNEGAWLLVGPRRSNHYLLMTKGAENTPSVSIMASATEVEALAPLHVSLSATNSQMAEVAAKEAKKRLTKKAPTYLTVLSADCLSCRDFSSLFDQQAEKLGVKKIDEVLVSGEAPETTVVTDKIRKHSPSFVLLPNYSKISSYLMAVIHNSDSRPFFVGADGWGDSNFGFVQSNPHLKTVEGFCVRGLPPLKQGLDRFDLGRRLQKEADFSGSPFSGPALAILKTVDSTVELLCKTKPRKLDEFRTAFAQRSSKRFRSPWGVSIYKLAGDQLQFERTIGGSR